MNGTEPNREKKIHNTVGATGWLYSESGRRGLESSTPVGMIAVMVGAAT